MALKWSRVAGGQDADRAEQGDRGAPGLLRPRSIPVREGHRRACHHAPLRRASGEAILRLVGRLQLRPARRTYAASAAWHHHLDRRSSGKSIYPYRVRHQRENPNNFLTLENRKASNHTALDHDQHKLMALTDAHVWFAFWIGVLLVLDKHHVTISEVYVSGVLDQPLSRWFATRLEEIGLRAAR